jgi:hypothetical protein
MTEAKPAAETLSLQKKGDTIENVQGNTKK